MKNQEEETFQNWNTAIDELNLQLNLGMSEAQDAYDEQRKKLKHWLDENESKIDELIAEGKSELKDLKIKMEELRVQAALGKAETRDALKEQEKELHHKLHDMKHEATQAYHNSSDASREFLDKVQAKSEDFQTKFELFNLQMHLAASDASDFWDEKKKELSIKLQELQHKAEQMKEDAEVKWDHFSDEMESSWQHFRKAFKA